MLKLIRAGLLAVLLVACSVEISDVTPNATAPLPTPFVSIITTVPPATATATLTLTLAPPTPTSTSLAVTSNTSNTISLTPIPAPLPWAALNLSGQLIYLNYLPALADSPLLIKLDLASGQQTTLFQPPPTAWLVAARLSPDGKKFVLAYAPPVPAGQSQIGYTELYLMAADGSGALEPLVTRSQKKEAFFQPTWSPDGRYIYYIHTAPNATNTDFETGIERIAYPGGQPEVIMSHAIWPRLSPDGSKLVYVAYDPANGVNDLYIADSDGQNPVPLMQPGTFLSVDAPVFTPDGGALLFSATGEGPAPALSWLDRLFGVQSASANGAPSDWWSIELASRKLQRLTTISETGLYGSFAPDGQYFAFVGYGGVYVMKPDGSNLMLLFETIDVGPIDWIPPNQ